MKSAVTIVHDINVPMATLDQYYTSTPGPPATDMAP